MWETGSYKTHEDHKNLYEALKKLMNRDHSDQLQVDLAEARKKHRKRLDSSRTPSGSPPPPLPPPPSSPGASGAPWSSQLPSPPPSSSSRPVDSDKSKQQTNVLGASDSKKPLVITHQSSTWTISDTRDKPLGSSVHFLSPPDDQQLNDDSVLADEEHSFGDDDLGTVLKVLLRKGWWKPCDDDERPATPEPASVIPTSHIPDAVNNWANALASTYQASAENSLLAKTGDMRTFMNWYCQKVGKIELTQADFEGQAYEVVKAFYLDIVHLQFQIEECHKMLTDQIEWLIPKKFYIDRHTTDSSRKAVRTHMRILSFVRIKAYSRYGYDYLKEITLRRADYQEYMIAEKDFKNLYPSDFEDLNLLLLQSHLNHLSSSDKRWDAKGFEYKHDYTIIESPHAVVFPICNNEWKIMQFSEIYKFSDGTLINILEALDYRVKEYRVNRFNPETQDQKDLSKLEMLQDVDYRLLQRIE
uniref:Uncharacterized protein n=1 Tax=Tanacetum cinerariifolium TaxID=118510 RepID=A0A699IP64_TANCI|nr:hypothetical protein [Tanacetum cinerariifolium]